MASKTINNYSSNSDNSDFAKYLNMVKDGLRKIGNAAVTKEHGTDSSMSGIVMLYQTEDEFRNNVAQFLKFSGKVSKKTHPADFAHKQRLNLWMHDLFGLTKPVDGAVGDERTRYTNRVSAVKTTFKRAVAYAERGLVFTMNERNQCCVTVESYNRVIQPEKPRTSDVPVSDKAHADSGRATWARLMPKQENTEEAVTNGETITPTAANFRAWCNGTRRSAELVEREKLTGTDQIEALRAFFALATLLGQEPKQFDKTLVKRLDELENDSARKSA